MAHFKHLTILASGVALSSLFAADAVAQSASQADTEASTEQSGGLSEIIVTAQRRSESAQTVPIAVAAFSSDTLATSRTLSSDDLATLVPGLSIAPNAARSPLYLRGVGNNNQGASPAVLTFIDGVYMPFNMGQQAFNDVAMMEIAKGPQGTLFGRNATGGVIQITTKAPTVTPSAEFELGYANYQTVSAKAFVSGGLAENLRASVAGFYMNQLEGWGTNTAIDGEQFLSRNYGGRTKFVFDASAATQFTLALDYAYGFGHIGSHIGGNAEQRFTFDVLTQHRQFFNGRFDIASDLQPYFTTEEFGASLTVNSKLGELNLLSISSWRRNNVHFQIDYDGTPVNFFNIVREGTNTAYAQELQISSPSDGRFKWVAGLFYFGERPKDDPVTFSGPALQFVFGTPPGLPLRTHSSDKGDAYAAYGQASLELMPATTLTLGGRYTIEKRQQTGFVDLGPGAVIPSSVGGQSATFKKPTFRVSLDHQFSPDLMVYASFNRGFNSGWFNRLALRGYRPADNPVISPETIDAYEVGFKSQFLDRRLRVNVSAFQYNYTNLQLQFYEFGGLITKNAAGAKIRGVDVDVQARPVNNLDLTVSASFLDPKFSDFPGAPFYAFLPSGEFAVLDPALNPGQPANAAGFSTTAAPHFSLNASASHRLETSVGTFHTSASLNYRGTTYGDSFERFPLKKRTLVNLSGTWEAPDRQLSITGWVKNLTNESYDEFLSLVTPVGVVGQPGAPRTYGVTLGYKFGG